MKDRLHSVNLETIFDVTLIWSHLWDNDQLEFHCTQNVTTHSSWLMAPWDGLRKVSRTTSVLLRLPCYWFPTGGCVIDTNTPCLAVMALSAENLLTSIMHSCIPIPESFPLLPVPLLDCKHVKEGSWTYFFFSCTALSMVSNQNQL